MSQMHMPLRTAARLGRSVTALAWGAFKIGRNEGIKYPQAYDLPSDEEASALIHGVIALGIRAIDTAPAYGLSESRIGNALALNDALHREQLFISTKAGERFVDGRSTYDFTKNEIARSVVTSLERLRAPRVDAVFVHSDGSDTQILRDGGAITALDTLKDRGVVGAVGFSPKSVDGEMAALADSRVDALMVELHPDAREMLPVIDAARKQGVAVFVKKPLASGRLDPARAIPWILGHAGVTSVVLGGLSLDRLRANAALASAQH